MSVIGPVDGGARGGVICLAELDGATVADASLRALRFAATLSEADAATAVVFPMGPAGAGGADFASLIGTAGGDGVADLFAGFGAAEVCVITHEIDGYAPAAWASSLAQLMAAGEVSAVVAAATDRGSEVLAHLGAMTGLPVAANCIAAQGTGAGIWQLTRQRWAGSVLEDAVLEAPCALLTVAADALPAAAGSAAAGSAAFAARPEVLVFAPTLTAADLHVCATESAEQSSGISLANARVVVGGGRGVGGPDGFAALEELAGLLGGVVGVSRVVTSQGWRPHRQQVGQTGTKISPELYLACGISGAIQHMAGCMSARHIVVVNTDADAPIITHAEYAVIGDLNEIVPALIAAIRAQAG